MHTIPVDSEKIYRVRFCIGALSKTSTRRFWMIWGGGVDEEMEIILWLGLDDVSNSRTVFMCTIREHLFRPQHTSIRI
jgi:hypothetical protein